MAGMPKSSLQGCIHGVFRNRLPIGARVVTNNVDKLSLFTLQCPPCQISERVWRLFIGKNQGRTCPASIFLNDNTAKANNCRSSTLWRLERLVSTLIELLVQKIFFQIEFLVFLDVAIVDQVATPL